MKKIKRVQRRARKLIPEIHNRPYQERPRNLKLPSLAYRRKRGDMIYMYKIMSGNINIRKEDFFAATQCNTRGHSHKVLNRVQSNILGSTRSRTEQSMTGTNYHVTLSKPSR